MENKNLIDTLKARKQELTVTLATCTDEKAYDLIAAELASVSKTLTLTENRERQRRQEEAEKLHKANLAKYNAELKRIEKAKQDADELDKAFFEKIHEVYSAYSSTYDLRKAIMEATAAMLIPAEELGLEPPKPAPIMVCGWRSTKDRHETLMDLIGQYDLAAAHIQDAKRRGDPHPDKPGMDWFIKGGGQFWEQPKK